MHPQAEAGAAAKNSAETRTAAETRDFSMEKPLETGCGDRRQFRDCMARDLNGK